MNEDEKSKLIELIKDEIAKRDDRITTLETQIKEMKTFNSNTNQGIKEESFEESLNAILGLKEGKK